MATDAIVDSDYLISQIANSIVSTLDGLALSLGAYNTQVNPNPATPLSALTAFECTFDTYARIPFPAPWAAAFFILPGEWGSQSPNLSWASPVAVGDTIAGLFLVDGTLNLLMTYEFRTPIIFNPGDPAVNFILQHNSWARVLFP